MMHCNTLSNNIGRPHTLLDCDFLFNTYRHILKSIFILRIIDIGSRDPEGLYYRTVRDSQPRRKAPYGIRLGIRAEVPVVPLHHPCIGVSELGCDVGKRHPMVHKSARIRVPELVEGEGRKPGRLARLVHAIDLVVRGPTLVFHDALPLGAEHVPSGEK